MDREKTIVETNSSDNQRHLRSEKVQKILGDIPPALVTWAAVIIATILIALLVVGCIVPYPYSHGESIIQHLLSL